MYKTKLIISNLILDNCEAVNEVLGVYLMQKDIFTGVDNNIKGNLSPFNFYTISE